MVPRKLISIALFVVVSASCFDWDDGGPDAWLGDWESDPSAVRTTTIAGRDYEYRFIDRLTLSADGTFRTGSIRLDGDGSVLGPVYAGEGVFRLDRGRIEFTTRRSAQTAALFDPNLRLGPVTRHPHWSSITLLGRRLRIEPICGPLELCSGPVYYNRVPDPVDASRKNSPER